MTTYLESLQQHLHQLLSADPTVFVIGEDILDPYGGAFKVTKGLSTKFPDRVITTPISEAGFIGVANGMALRGLKPIVEIMFGDFITLAADQIINYAAKFAAMYQSTLDYHLVIRMPVGGGRGYGPTHSQSLEKLFLGIPHITILAPSIYHDPGLMLATAIQQTGPVLFLEHKLLYSQEILTSANSPFAFSLTENTFPLVRLSNNPEKTADITLITYGGALWLPALLQKMAEEEIWLDVLIPSSLNQTAHPLLAASASQSGLVVIVEEGAGPFGWGAQIAYDLQNAMLNRLTTPITVIHAENTIIPATQALEQLHLPSLKKIEQKIYEVLS
jgi:pyruvate/2-oxoglutarate/acetoin dehydrogenase E1 component